MVWRHAFRATRTFRVHCWCTSRNNYRERTSPNNHLSIRRHCSCSLSVSVRGQRSACVHQFDIPRVHLPFPRPKLNEWRHHPLEYLFYLFLALNMSDPYPRYTSRVSRSILQRYVWTNPWSGKTLSLLMAGWSPLSTLVVIRV